MKSLNLRPSEITLKICTTNYAFSSSVCLYKLNDRKNHPWGTVWISNLCKTLRLLYLLSNGVIQWMDRLYWRYWPVILFLMFKDKLYICYAIRHTFQVILSNRMKLIWWIFCKVPWMCIVCCWLLVFGSFVNLNVFIASGEFLFWDYWWIPCCEISLRGQ